MLHPAAKIPFNVLFEELEKRVALGLVSVREDKGLRQYTYTHECTMQRAWDDYTSIARGIILNLKEQMVWALPFPKFFNWGERPNDVIPNEPFTIYEKIDGSLIIAYFDEGKWRCATKGSFNSEQARWAEQFLKEHPVDMDECCTYLFECIYPSNKIVVNYKGREALYVLGAYDENGKEWEPDYNKFPFEAFEGRAEYPLCPTHHYSSIEELLAKAKELPKDSEGWVIRFQNGYRIKIKGDAYVAAHKVISNLTPLGIWELLYLNVDLDIVRKELLEEFIVDFDQIVHILTQQLNQHLTQVNTYYDQLSILGKLNRKEFAKHVEALNTPRYKPIYFMLYDNNLSGIKSYLLKLIRPTNNRLNNYIPRSALNRFIEPIH